MNKDTIKKTKYIILILMTCLVITVFFSFFTNEIDSLIYNEIIEKMNPHLTLIMKFITKCGNSKILILICLSLFLFPRIRTKGALLINITTAVSSITNVIMKLIIGRERPDILRLINETNYSFPSGHAMINMTFYMMLLLWAWRYVKNKAYKYIIMTICLIIPLLIGLSRIYLGVHYATDVLAGWLFGASIAFISFIIFNKKEGENNIWKISLILLKEYL